MRSTFPTLLRQRRTLFVTLLALALNACGPSNQPTPPGATGTTPDQPLSIVGLQADYFSRADLSGPSVHQTDSVLDFNWGRLSAARGVRPGQFSARWNAQLTAPTSGKYTVHLTATDGQAQLFLGNQALSDGAIVQLDAGKPQALRVVFTQTGAEPALRLEWESQEAGIKREVIPTVRLAPVTVSRQNVATGGAPRGQNLLTNGDFEGAALPGSGTSRRSHRDMEAQVRPAA